LTTKINDLLIIGAGFAGLVTAYECLKSGIQKITLIDKGRSVGGRLATRRINGSIADHGAQFFTIRSKDFEKFIKEILPTSVLLKWPKVEINKTLKNQSTDKFAIRGGINQLAKHVAKHIEETVSIDLNVRISALSITKINNLNLWKVVSIDEKTFYARKVILTPPLPQSLEIIGKSEINLPSEDQDTLNNIRYTRCLCALILTENEIALPYDLIKNPSQNITLIADNYKKDPSNQHVLTVHTTSQFSEENWNNNDALSIILNEVKTYLGSIEARVLQLKKWRYARPITVHPEEFLLISPEPLLICCGDSFGGARVEGAYLSGKSTAEFIIKSFHE
jgi:predicted NAD/FAD-dependent oxidoreductase